MNVFSPYVKRAADCDHIFQQAIQVSFVISLFDGRLSKERDGSEGDGTVLFQRDLLRFLHSQILLPKSVDDSMFRADCSEKNMSWGNHETKLLFIKNRQISMRQRGISSVGRPAVGN